MLVVELPWPHRDLSPNSRKHWTSKASKAKAARRTAYILTKQVLNAPYLALTSKATGVMIGLQFYPKDGRHYDLDNLFARMKSSLDGIADALVINDRQFGYGGMLMEQPEKPGRVVVTIQERV